MNSSANPDDDERPRGGRPSKLTEQILTLTVELLIRGNFRSVVATRIGVGARTFRHWMKNGKKYPDGIYGRFRTAVLKAETEAETRAVGNIMEAGKDDPKYLCWFLERKFPQRWGRYRGELGQLKKRITELEKLLGSDSGEPADSPSE
jgi:hypothetical protein